MNTTLVAPATGKVRWGYVLGSLLAFLLLPPVIGLPIVVAMVWRKSNATKSDYMLLMLCIAVYLAAINATKAPGGDGVNYYVAYKNVPEVGFIKSLIYIYGIDYIENADKTQISGEFMNGVYNYVGYYLTFGHYTIFAALLTLADYILLFLGLYRWAQSLRRPHIPIVCGVLIISFFYLFFQFTLHIQKQFLAQCIMMFVLGTYAQRGRMTLRLWLVAACAVFTHASTWLFVPFLLYKPLRRRLSKTSLLMLAVMLFLFIAYGTSFMGDVAKETTSTVAYGAQRFANSEGQVDAVGSSMVLSQVLVIAVPMALIVFRQLWLRRRDAINDSQAFMLNIVMLLLLAIVAMFNKPLARYRYFMMLFAFMPFVYPYLSNNSHTRDFCLKALSFIMIGWFYWQFPRMIWQFASEWQIIVYPPAVLIGLDPWNV